ncbi:MAG TPA: hypothetical protein VEY08_09645, partial [Chloroflexia bacterium]|nr:hypothetical protein [Chloroflexia bacterium]
MIGVHAGKFIAERATANIRVATRRLGIEHPVVNDRHFRTWRAFGVQAWPTIVLVSPNGEYIGQHAGEFAFEDFDHVIQMAADSYSQVGLLNHTPLHFPLDSVPPNDSPLLFPGKVLADPDSNRLFIADTGHNRVLVAHLGPDDKSAQVTQVIGSGEAGLQDGNFSGAQFRHPEGMVLVGNTLY